MNCLYAKLVPIKPFKLRELPFWAPLMWIQGSSRFCACGTFDELFYV